MALYRRFLRTVYSQTHARLVVLVSLGQSEQLQPLDTVMPPTWWRGNKSIIIFFFSDQDTLKLEVDSLHLSEIFLRVSRRSAQIQRLWLDSELHRQQPRHQLLHVRVHCFGRKKVSDVKGRRAQTDTSKHQIKPHSIEENHVTLTWTDDKLAWQSAFTSSI